MRKYLLICLGLIALPSAASIDFTFFGKSVHPFSDNMNGDHQLLGLEYRKDNHSYGISTYVNSYNIRAYMATSSWYVPHNTHYETVFLVGATTGYKNTGSICLIEVGNFCSVLGLGIRYTKYRIKPQVTLFGEAVVFSLSYTF